MSSALAERVEETTISQESPTEQILIPMDQSFYLDPNTVEVSQNGRKPSHLFNRKSVPVLSLSSGEFQRASVITGNTAVFESAEEGDETKFFVKGPRMQTLDPQFKYLTSEADVQARQQDFVREGVVLRRLQEVGAGISPEFHGFATNPKTGEKVLVMDFVDGPTARDFSRRDESLDPVLQREMSTLVWFRTVWALSEAHKEGIVNGDFTDRDVRIDRTTGKIMIVDWEFAEDGHYWGRRVHGVGSAGFAAPEQAPLDYQTYGFPKRDLKELITDIHPTTQSDVYGLGALLFKMLHEVYIGEINEDAFKNLPISLNPEYKNLKNLLKERFPDIVEVMDNATADEPNKRYTDATELLVEAAKTRLSSFVRLEYLHNPEETLKQMVADRETGKLAA